MFWRRKTVDLQRGKEIFYRYRGNRFFIDREEGRVYRKCNIPKETEEEWRQDILRRIEREIASLSGAARVDAIFGYLDLLQTDDACRYLIDFLNTARLDTFSAIILCEGLRNYLRKSDLNHLSTALCVEGNRMLGKMKTELLSAPLTVDESYRTLPWMDEDDFSEEALTARIGRFS